MVHRLFIVVGHAREAKAAGSVKAFMKIWNSRPSMRTILLAAIEIIEQITGIQMDTYRGGIENMKYII